MQFNDKPLETFGEVFLQISVPTQLSLKTPLVFRMLKDLKERGYLPWTGSHRAELCFDEALMNAMIHGNRLDPARKVNVRLFGDAKRWGAIIEDEGAGFRPDAVPKAAEETFVEEAGRGIMLMDSWLDDLAYAAPGNRLRMVRRRQSEPDATEIAAALEGETVPGAKGAGPLATSVENEVGLIEMFAARITEDNVDVLREAVAGMDFPVVIDLQHVEYISSVGLGALVAAHKLMRQRQRKFVLAGLQPAVKDILESAHLLRIFRVADDRAGGIAEALNPG